MGEDVRKPLRRLARAAILVLLLMPTASACLTEPRQPDLSTREEFARSVMAAAVAGSVERVEGLVDPVFSNTRPEAQQLVDAARGWAPGSWQLAISSDFPEIAAVTVRRTEQDPTVRYTISWSGDRWKLVMGESEGTAGGAANPIAPGPDARILPAQPTQLPVACPSGAGAAVTGTGAAALACRTFTSTSGYARGQNMQWLASSPLDLGFEPMDGVLTMVVRMPCGVLNVPVAADDFGLIPEPARMATSADGCVGPASDHRSWTTDYFKEPMVYRLDSSELVLTSELGQIRLKRD